MSDSESNASEDWDESDKELQAAFEAGLLQPGLHVVKSSDSDQSHKKVAVNNVAGLKEILTATKSSLPWIEHLDICTAPAPLAPEIALQMSEHKTRRENLLKQNKPGKRNVVENDPVHNDFVREMNFYRQAQAAVLAVIPKLHQLNVPTLRPPDYFAQMLKDDQHMQKVRQTLVQKQMTSERCEKVRKLREMKKLSKQVQTEARLKKEKEKKNILTKVSQYQQGRLDTLDFLEERRDRKVDVPVVGQPRQQLSTNTSTKKSMKKRQRKDEKYGFGGKKRRSKWNTSESSSGLLEGGGGRGKGGAGGGVRRGTKGRKGPKGGSKRPGKNARNKSRSKFGNKRK